MKHIMSGKISKKKLQNIYDTNNKSVVDKEVYRRAAYLSNPENYLYQFNPLTYDNTGLPNESNKGDDIYLQRELNFKEGYSKFDNSGMDYGVVGEKELFHNNMIPNTSSRDIPSHNSLNQNRHMEIMTGALSEYKPKRENKNLFEPMTDVSNVNGMPLFIDKIQNRYKSALTDKKQNGDLPFENNIRVIPGVNGEIQNGTYKSYRINPKTTEIIRGKYNPKISFKADKVEAIMKSSLRGEDFNLTKYKKKDYMVRDVKDFNPVYHQGISKDRSRAKIQKSRRNFISKHHQGPAIRTTIGNVPNKDQTEIIKSGKIVYHSDGISRNIKEVNHKPVLQNQKSVNLLATHRDTTSHSIHGIAINENLGSYAIDRKDIPLTTLRELTILSDYQSGIGSNTNKETYVFSKDLVMPTTIKETTVINKYDGPIHNSQENFGNYTRDKNDIAKRTIKETTEIQNHNGIVSSNFNEFKSYSIDPNDKPKVTIKQTTLRPSIEGIIDQRYVQSYTNMNPPNTTNKETLLTNKYKAIIDTITKKHKAVNYNDVPRNTIKQTTVNLTVDPNIQPTGGVSYASLGDKARETIKSTTLHSTQGGRTTNLNKGSYIMNDGLIPNPTIRQQTSHSISGTIQGQDYQGYVKDSNMKAKSTIKESTLYVQPETNLRDIVAQMSYTRDKKMMAKKTKKQTTLYNQPEVNLKDALANRSYVKDNNMIAKKTKKQDTLYQTPGGRAEMNTKSNYIRSNNLKAKTTKRQNTTVKNHTGPLQSHNVNKQRVHDDIKNMKIRSKRESTLISRSGCAKSDQMGPKRVPINSKKNKIDQKMYIKPKLSISKSSSNIDKIYTRNKTTLSKFNYNISNSFVSELAKNPLVNNLIHQKNYKF